MGNSQYKILKKEIKRHPLNLQKEAIDFDQEMEVNSEIIQDYDKDIRLDFQHTQQTELFVGYQDNLLEKESDLAKIQLEETSSQRLLQHQSIKSVNSPENLFPPQYQLRQIPDTCDYYQNVDLKQNDVNKPNLNEKFAQIQGKDDNQKNNQKKNYTDDEKLAQENRIKISNYYKEFFKKGQFCEFVKNEHTNIFINFIKYCIDLIIQEIYNQKIKNLGELKQFINTLKDPITEEQIEFKTQEFFQNNQGIGLNQTQEEREEDFKNKLNQFNLIIKEYKKNIDKYLDKIILTFQDELGNSLLFYAIFSPQQYNEGGSKFVEQVYGRQITEESLVGQTEQKKTVFVPSSLVQDTFKFTQNQILSLNTDFIDLKERQQTKNLRQSQQSQKNKQQNKLLIKSQLPKLYPHIINNYSAPGPAQYSVQYSKPQTYDSYKTMPEKEKQLTKYLMIQNPQSITFIIKNKEKNNDWLHFYMKSQYNYDFQPKIIPKFKKYGEQQGYFDKLKNYENNQNKNKLKIITLSEYQEQYSLKKLNYQKLKQKQNNQKQQQGGGILQCCSGFQVQKVKEKNIFQLMEATNKDRIEYLRDIWIEKQAMQELQDSVYQQYIQQNSNSQNKNDEDDDFKDDNDKEDEKEDQEAIERKEMLKQVMKEVNQHENLKQLENNKPQDKFQIQNFIKHQKQNQDQIQKLNKKLLKNKLLTEKEKEQQKQELIEKQKQSYTQEEKLILKTLKLNNRKLHLSPQNKQILTNYLEILAYEQAYQLEQNELKKVIMEQFIEKKKQENISKIKKKQEELLGNATTSKYTILQQQISQSYLLSTSSAQVSKQFLENNNYNFVPQNQQISKDIKKNHPVFQNMFIFELYNELFEQEQEQKQRQLFFCKEYLKGLIFMMQSLKIGHYEHIKTFIVEIQKYPLFKKILQEIFQTNIRPEFQISESKFIKDATEIFQDTYQDQIDFRHPNKFYQNFTFLYTDYHYNPQIYEKQVIFLRSLINIINGNLEIKEDDSTLLQESKKLLQKYQKKKQIYDPQIPQLFVNPEQKLKNKQNSNNQNHLQNFVLLESLETEVELKQSFTVYKNLQYIFNKQINMQCMTDFQKYKKKKIKVNLYTKI